LQQTEPSTMSSYRCPPCLRSVQLRQKKVAKEKATPGSVPAAPVPCATRRAGRLA